MNVELLEILRCPYCGGRLTLVDRVFHAQTGDEIHDGVLQCQCSCFPLVARIPVMHLEEPVPAALEYLKAERPDLARRAMFDLEADHADRFEDAARSETTTYRALVDALGPRYEREYFIYRFSDPSYVVAHALIRAVAGTTLRGGGRAIDICGGSGHLTRVLTDVSSPAPVLVDLNFVKIWLARRFTAPDCEGVCCQANAPLPFARGSFRYVMCADAFMFIWTKRRLIGEMSRLIDDQDQRRKEGTHPGAVVISHAHNELQWSESLGQALPPDGYRALFESIEPRLFSEAKLFADVVKGGPLDLARRDPVDALECDPALTIVATRHAEVFRPHALDYASGAPGDLRVNPLYVVARKGDRIQLRLQFPSPEYEEEFGACRDYLPDVAEIDLASMAALAAGYIPSELADLVRRRVVLDLPKRYY